MGARSDTDDVRFGNAVFQLIPAQRFLVIFDLAVAGLAETLHRAAADAFEQQYLDVLFRERGLHDGPMTGKVRSTMPDVELLAAMQHWTWKQRTGRLGTCRCLP